MFKHRTFAYDNNLLVDVDDENSVQQELGHRQQQPNLKASIKYFSKLMF